MDLKDVVERVHTSSDEAHKAFHAGHPDVAEKYLMDQMVDIGKYFDEKTTPASDVTESATSETPADETKETPAEVPGAQVRPAAVVQEKPVQPAADLTE